MSAEASIQAPADPAVERWYVWRDHPGPGSKFVVGFNGREIARSKHWQDAAQIVNEHNAHLEPTPIPIIPRCCCLWCNAGTEVDCPCIECSPPAPDPVPTGDVGTCRSCGAPIRWGLTKNGKRMPISVAMGLTHFADCPQSKRWSGSGRRS